MTFSFEQLEDLWVACGGPAGSETNMAAIAIAESGGDPDAKNFNANETEDRGLWQINSGAWPQFNPPYDLFDARQNCKAAIVVLAQQGITAWSTWNNGAAARVLAARSTSGADA